VVLNERDLAARTRGEPELSHCLLMIESARENGMQSAHITHTENIALPLLMIESVRENGMSSAHHTLGFSVTNVARSEMLMRFHRCCTIMHCLFAFNNCLFAFNRFLVAKPCSLTTSNRVRFEASALWGVQSSEYCVHQHALLPIPHFPFLLLLFLLSACGHPRQQYQSSRSDEYCSPSC
jgi:hypothetical protein